MRLLVAFLVAPISFGLLLVLLTSFFGSSPGGLWALKLLAVIAYPVTAVIGIPAHLILAKLRRTGLVWYLSVSGLISIIPIAYFVIIPRIENIRHYPGSRVFSGPSISLSALILLACLFTGLVFWLIARPDRPGTGVGLRE